MTRVTRVLIIGGGIGGLVAATGFAQRGVEVDLVEVKSDFAIRGVGLGQPANALRALRAIGVLDECLKVGFQFSKLRFCDAAGKLIVEHSYRLGDEITPALNALPRTELHRILITAAQRAGVNIYLNTTAESWNEDPDGIDVKFSGGKNARYDLVVGFDGNRSGIRRYLYGNAFEPVNSGIAAWRVTLHRPAEIEHMEFYQGLGHKTGVMPLSHDSMYLFHIRPEPIDARYDPGEFLDMLRERTTEYTGVIGEVMKSLTPEHDIVYSPLQPVNVAAPWYRGRVVIAGDAAHACPPHMTQGAAMAMEDGLVLAECVTTDSSLETQLTDFMLRRGARVSLVQRYASKMLADEQAIKTAEQFEAAKARMPHGLSEWLATGDEVMNQQVLAPDWSDYSGRVSAATSTR